MKVREEGCKGEPGTVRVSPANKDCSSNAGETRLFATGVPHAGLVDPAFAWGETDSEYTFFRRHTHINMMLLKTRGQQNKIHEKSMHKRSQLQRGMAKPCFPHRSRHETHGFNLIVKIIS